MRVSEALRTGNATKNWIVVLIVVMGSPIPTFARHHQTPPRSSGFRRATGATVPLHPTMGGGITPTFGRGLPSVMTTKTKKRPTWGRFPSLTVGWVLGTHLPSALA